MPVPVRLSQPGRTGGRDRFRVVLLALRSIVSSWCFWMPTPLARSWRCWVPGMRVATLRGMSWLATQRRSMSSCHRWPAKCKVLSAASVGCRDAARRV